MTKMTNGEMFKLTGVSKIKGAEKDFRAITFRFAEHKMNIGFGKEDAKIYWAIEGRGTRVVTKTEIYKWLNQYEGADAKKIAGYLRLMKPVIAASAASGQTTGRRATNGSPRLTLGKVPVFTRAELSTMKPVQLKGIAHTIERALASEAYVNLIEKLNSYLAYVSGLLGTVHAETRPLLADGVKEGSEAKENSFLSSLDAVASLYQDTTEEADQREADHRVVLAEMTVKQLKAYACDRGISLSGLKKKAEIFDRICAVLS